MYKNISTNNQKIYKIINPGDYIFYFENKIGKITFDILCEKVTIQIYGLYRGNNNDEFNLHIIQNHKAPNSKSKTIIKSVLNDKSTLNLTATINITKKANNSIAHLINNNLLLSKFARVITSPILEVSPSEIECTHATTTAPLSQNQLNYLQSRGLSTNDSKQLLINGFVDEVLKAKNKS